MAAFYPACGRCPHLTDSGTISTQRVQKLERYAQHSESGDSLFGPEGISGIYRNELDAATARRVGQSFGLHLAALPFPKGKGNAQPIVLLAGDGQSAAAELKPRPPPTLRIWTGVSGGNRLRRGHCPPSLLASFRAALGGTRAAALVANPDGRPGHVGLTMWGRGGLPLSAGGELDRVRRIFEISGVPRAARPTGGFARESVDGPYLSDLAEFYHALAAPAHGDRDELAGVALLHREVNQPRGD